MWSLWTGSKVILLFINQLLLISYVSLANGMFKMLIHNLLIILTSCYIKRLSRLSSNFIAYFHWKYWSHNRWRNVTNYSLYVVWESSNPVEIAFSSRCQFHQKNWAAFLFESLFRSFYLLVVLVCNFLSKEYCLKNCS